VEQSPPRVRIVGRKLDGRDVKPIGRGEKKEERGEEIRREEIFSKEVHGEKSVDERACRRQEGDAEVRVSRVSGSKVGREEIRDEEGGEKVGEQ